MSDKADVFALLIEELALFFAVLTALTEVVCWLWTAFIAYVFIELIDVFAAVIVAWAVVETSSRMSCL